MSPRPYVSKFAPLANIAPVDRAAIGRAAQAFAGVPASQLTPPQKNLVWRHIKANEAEQRAFLADPLVQRLIAERGAVPVFPPELIRAALAPTKVTKP